MTKPPVIIHGQQVGRLRASWLLFKESWRFFKADPEMFWVPIIFSIINLVLLGAVVGISTLLYLSAGITSEEQVSEFLTYLFLFAVYVVAAFTFALSQAAIVHTVYTRAHGGDATLRESLRVAFSHKGSLFLWALITSTVGIVLHYVAERSRVLGKIIVWLIGAAWAVLTYFVVTAVVLEKQSAFQAVKRSGHVFKTTWGETFVSNISLGLVFFLAHFFALVVFVGFIVLAAATGITGVYLVAFVALALWFFVAILVHEVLQAVLKTLLYIYATEQSVPGNFDQELLQAMLVRQSHTTNQVHSV